MQINASMVKEHREKTGVGMMTCKKALAETDGDIEAAIEHLKQKGVAKAASKAGRDARDGARSEAFDHEAIARKLGAKLGRELTRILLIPAGPIGRAQRPPMCRNLLKEKSCAGA